MNIRRLESVPAPRARTEVRREIETGDVVEFARGGIPRGERVVAVADAGRMEALWGAGPGQRVVRLSADAVSRHARFGGFGATDWLRVQRLVDAGTVIREPRHRVLWIEDAGETWMVVLKRTRRDEVYVDSCRRARPRDVARLERRGRARMGGTPQPPADPKATRQA